MKIGIEIHQRLETRKLFCRCPSLLDEKASPALSIERRLHPVVSEMGELDMATLAESEKDRLFRYQVYPASDCLVEMDEEPPSPMNMEALKIALEISAQLSATPVDEVQVMRKMVIDGSNTSGFQRTSLVALGGYIESSQGPVHIPMIAIEEDSAGIVSNSETEAEYRLDRLGIPLIEISTEPQIKDGAHLLEVAEKIGMVLRATGKVARGLGTIRQDVNISTAGGARVEIKGAQDLKMLPTLADIEVKRQTALLSLLSELRARNAIPNKPDPADVSDLLKGTSAKLIAKGLSSGFSVVAQKLWNHKGLLGRELQPGKRYGTELSDYAKRAGVKGIIHSDEDLAKYGLTEAEISSISKALSIKEQDAFIMVVAPKEQAIRAIGFALERANLDKVPSETRRANPDGTSSYMRPIPGRARMYPETDIPPIPITKELLDSIERSESLEEKQERLAKLLNKEMAKVMLKSRNLRLFEALVEMGIEPMLAASTLENTLVSLRREGIELQDPESALLDMFKEYLKGSFVKAAIPEVLKGMAKGARAEAVIKVYRLQKISGKDLESLAKENFYNLQTIMQNHRLQVDPAEVAALLKKHKK